MFDPSSRYYRIADATRANSDGSTIVYKRRRLPPCGSSIPVQATTAVKQADRLDLIAYRTIGDATLFWRIADANDAMNPFDLLRRATLRIPTIRA